MLHKRRGKRALEKCPSALLEEWEHIWIEKIPVIHTRKGLQSEEWEAVKTERGQSMRRARDRRKNNKLVLGL